jgi:predicted ester cyclase
MVGAVPDTRHAVGNVVEGGDQVVLEFRWQGTHTRPLRSPQGEIPATGKRIDLRCGAVFEVAAGRITAERGYLDQVEFLTQLGLMPAPASA